jgi:hypothetical protein
MVIKSVEPFRFVTRVSCMCFALVILHMSIGVSSECLCRFIEAGKRYLFDCELPTLDCDMAASLCGLLKVPDCILPTLD